MTRKLLSFCTPVMNRLGDLQSTLERNLADNLESCDRVEFVVIGFDRDDATERWVRDEFPEPLASGYLRFQRSSALSSWHFGRAKNAFRDLMQGRIYASLDGDNFTGRRGGEHIIEVFESQDYNCIFHQFQGDWGDGTCGRVSMTAEDYRRIGYDDHFLPRQWDELDAMLSILARERSRRYVCYRGKSIIRKSRPFARFLEENGLAPTVVELPPEADPLHTMITEAAVGKHKSTYVEEDPKLKYSSVYNHLGSFYKNTASDELRTRYAGELVETGRTMAERIDPAVLEGWFLEPGSAAIPDVGEQDIVLLACLKNEADLQSWLSHYRRLGVDRFLLVDDRSDPPLATRLRDPDVSVWTPKVGQFRYAKALWLELLIRSRAAGRWVLTVDADEFLDLPETWEEGGKSVSALRRLIAYAESRQITHFAGFLLDLMPGATSYDALRRGESLPATAFDHYQFRPGAAPDSYRRNPTVTWGVGAHADWSYRIDARFRLNRAFDSLRKFPVFKASGNFHLNQGFHDLLIEGVKRTPAEMARADLLPVLHYKLHQSQRDAHDAGLRPTDAYHPETRANLERLRASLDSALRQAAASPFAHPYLSYELMPVPGRSHITLKVTAARDIAARAYDDRLQRRASLPVLLGPGPARCERGVLHAVDLAAAVAWLQTHSPYRHLLEQDARTAKMGLGPVQAAPALAAARLETA